VILCYATEPLVGHVVHSLCALAVFCWRFEKHVGLVQCTWCTIKCRVDGVVMACSERSHTAQDT
jgi:hypothetical protein